MANMVYTIIDNQNVQIPGQMDLIPRQMDLIPGQIVKFLDNPGKT